MFVVAGAHAAAAAVDLPQVYRRSCWCLLSQAHPQATPTCSTLLLLLPLLLLLSIRCRFNVRAAGAC
jgi:hypothetical protein